MKLKGEEEMPNLYVATIQILVAVPDNERYPQEVASDAISGMLSDYEMGDGTLIDWAYLRLGGQRMFPSFVAGLSEEMLSGYKEGDFVSKGWPR